MALEDVVKQAKKNEQPLVEREAKKAHETMKNVLSHIDIYTRDYKNIELVDSMQNEMECGNLTNYGLLLHEVEDVSILYRRHDERQINPKHKLLLFEEVFVAFERREIQKFKKDKDGLILFNWCGEPEFTTVIKYYFTRTYNISRFSEINCNNKILALNTFLDGAILDKEHSLEIEFDTEEGRQTFMEMLLERQRKNNYFNNAKPGSNHEGHEFKKFQNEISYIDQVKQLILINYSRFISYSYIYIIYIIF